MDSATSAAGRLTPLQRKAWLLSAGGVALDGFDLFIMAVALPLLDRAFDTSAWLLGLTSSAAIIGAILGAALGGYLTDHFGRKSLFTWDLILFVVFALATAFAWDVWWLIAFRFLLGVAVGADYPIAASFSVEYLPAEVRGRFLVGGFSFQAIGMIAGALVGMLFLEIDPSVAAWRWMFAMGAVPALIIMWARRTVPETPAWQARTAAGKPPDRARYSELFRGANRRLTVLTAGGWFLMDVMMYGVGLFTPVLLASMGFARTEVDFITKDIAVTEGTAALDLMLVVGFIVAIVFVDRVGRLPLQKVGFLGCAVGLAILGTANAIGDPIWLVALGFGLFNLLINAGPNSTTFLLPAEVYPTRLRATGHGFAAAAGKTGAAVGVFVMPLLKDGLGVSVTVFLMAGVAVLGLLVTQFFGVETRGTEIVETVETDARLFDEVERVTALGTSDAG